MPSREFLAPAFMCSHKPPRVTQTKCVFLISAAEEPGNFVLIKTSQWFRDGGAHACTGSAGGWRFLGSVSAPPLTWPALAARNQGLVCDCKSCCFAARTRLCHDGGASGDTQMKNTVWAPAEMFPLLFPWSGETDFYGDPFSIAPLPFHWCSER